MGARSLKHRHLRSCPWSPNRSLFGLTSYPTYLYLGYMSTQKEKGRLELLQGTLDLLILRTLIYGPQHGRGIGRGWIAAEWEVSTNNREARFYTLTPTGRQQPVKEFNK